MVAAAVALLSALLELGLAAYDPLAAEVHVANQKYNVSGRMYKMHADGSSSWSGAHARLVGTDWLRHPPISASRTSTMSRRRAPQALLCAPSDVQRCRIEYEHCLRYDGPTHDLDVACHCARVYFSQCLFAAGCATTTMKQCYEMMAKHKCRDTTPCGNNCVTRNAELERDLHGSVTVQVVNKGNNYLKITTCNRTYDESTYARFGTVNEERCAGGTERACPYWIPPRMLTSLTFDDDTAYLRVEQCVLDTSRSPPHTNCFDSPRPVRIDGTAVRWPAIIEVAETKLMYCDIDADCPGSFPGRCVKEPLPPHTCDWEATDTDTVYPGFTQGGNPSIVPAEWKTIIRHHEFAMHFVKPTGMEDARS